MDPVAVEAHRCRPRSATRLRRPVEHHRHPVVDVFDGRAGLGRQDRTRRLHVSVRGVPESGEGERLVIRSVNSERLLRAPGLGLPLVVAIGDYETPAFGERLLERPLLRNGLRPGVDEALRFVSGRDDAPLGLVDDIGLVIADDRDVRLRGDVVPGFVVEFDGASEALLEVLWLR